MKVLHLDKNHKILAQKLKDASFLNEFDFESSKVEIEKIISDYDGIIIRSRFTIDKAFLVKAKNLKFIGRVGAGLENIDVEFAKKLGVKLFNASEGNANAVAEHALGMLLSLMNNFRKADKEVRNGYWLREENRGEELTGKTIGLIGYGNNGKAFARVLKGFNVNVLCVDILENVKDGNADQVGLERLFKEADVLSLHVPLTNLTKGMVDKSFLEKFKKSIYLINIARGQCVITEDLLNAIERGKVKAAALDVLEYEKSSFEKLAENGTLPTTFKKLLKNDKVLLTPHIAGWSRQSKIKLAEVIADKIISANFI